MKRGMIIALVLIFGFSFYYYLESSGITGFAVLTRQAILDTQITGYNSYSDLTGDCYTIIDGTITNKGNIAAINVTLSCIVNDEKGNIYGNGSVFMDDIPVGEKYFVNTFNSTCTEAMSGKSYSCNIV